MTLPTIDKTKIDIVAVIGSYLPLEKHGALFKACCPFHNERTPSFVIYADDNPQARCYGCGWRGDVFDFVQAKEGIDLHATVRRLQTGEFSAMFAPDKTRSQRANKPFVGTPAPSPATEKDMLLSMINSKKIDPPLSPCNIWPFYDIDGRLVGYELRYQHEGRKEPRPLFYGTEEGDRPRWRKRFPTGERPIYGIDRLGARPEAQIVITESAKKAEAAQRLFPTKTCLGWTGGANAWGKHQWGLLRKYVGQSPIILWPDADSQTATEDQARKMKIPVGILLPYHEQPGQRAMLSLARLLSNPMGLNLPVALVHVSDKSDGWDAADALKEGWSSDQARMWVKERLKRVEQYSFSAGL